MRSVASRWGPVITRAIGWLLIIAWLALLGWWIYTVYISEIITWIILTLIGCGRDYRGWVSAPRQIAVLVLGLPRSGKTRGLIIPNVAAWEGPVLATTTRRDVPDATCARRAQMGTVWVFDPLDIVDPLPLGARRLVWSPLRGCRDWDTARQRAEALAVDTGRGVEDATHWRTLASQLCAVLLEAAALEDRSMATVCAWAHAQRAEPAHAFCQKAESQAALAILHGLLRTPDRERGSIWSALQGMLSPFAHPQRPTPHPTH
ncbi:MAG: type IV secretory system conjugative DNA transfer family protein [Candidatus Dormibacteria bacterium]